MLLLLLEDVAGVPHIRDARVVALVPMVRRKVAGKTFLHVRAVHQLRMFKRLSLLDVDTLGNGVVV